MRICVTGGREFLDADLMNTVMDGFLEEWGITALAHGAQKAWMQLTKRWRGADYYAGLWAESRGIPVTEFPTSDLEWKQLARAAGPVRNRRMLDEFKPDRLVAFPGNKGTKDCVTAALERHIVVVAVDRSETDPQIIEITLVSPPKLF